MYPRPRGGKRDQLVLKVKSLLRGTEYERAWLTVVFYALLLTYMQSRGRSLSLGFSSRSLSRSASISQRLAHLYFPMRSCLSWRRSPRLSRTCSCFSLSIPRSSASMSSSSLLIEVRLYSIAEGIVLMFMVAFETSMKVKTSAQTGMPTLAVDLPAAVFDAMVRSSQWITDEEAWRGIMSLFPTQHSAYAQQVREAAAKRKEEGFAYILLYAVREDRIQLLALA